MTHSLVEARHGRGRTALVFALVVGSALVSGACGDGDSDSSATDGGGGGGSGGENGGEDGGGDNGAAPTGTIDEATLAKCPQSSSLIETTEWMTCLEGKRLTGVEPFNNTPCELRIGTNGAFEYVRDGAVALAVPERSAWLDATGTYQNNATSGRFLLASIAPDLPFVEGETRVDRISISLFALESQDDNVEVIYYDPALSRQTYNCGVDAL